MNTRRVVLTVAFLLVGVTFLWSIASPRVWSIWVYESFYILIGVPFFILTRKRWPLTTLAYCLLSIHAMILLVGAHYTYQHVPIGNWAREFFDLTRNHYDRFGHLAQGFVPAILVREILIRIDVVKNEKWLFVFVTSFCVSFAVFYEFIQWWLAVLGGSDPEKYLETQGDYWDSHKDILMALIGSVVAQTILRSLHNRQILDLKKMLKRT